MSRLDDLLAEYRKLTEQFFTARGPELENEEPGSWHVKACDLAKQAFAKHDEIMQEIGRSRRPEKGAKFLHARLLDEQMQPHLCVVTSLGKNDVKYALALPDGTPSSTRHYIEKHRFSTVVKEWVG